MYCCNETRTENDLKNSFVFRFREFRFGAHEIIRNLYFYDCSVARISKVGRSDIDLISDKIYRDSTFCSRSAAQYIWIKNAQFDHHVVITHFNSRRRSSGILNILRR